MIQGKPLEVNNFNTTETPISFKQMLKYWIILYIRDKHLTDQSSKNTKYMYIELNWTKTTKMDPLKYYKKDHLSVFFKTFPETTLWKSQTCQNNN